MKVYIAECGVYAEQYVEGVYATAQAAMDAHPVSTADAARERDRGRKAGWSKTRDGVWDNGCDYALAVVVTEYEVAE